MIKSKPKSGNYNAESILKCFICEVPDEEAERIEHQVELLSKIHVCQTCKSQVDIETKLLRGDAPGRNTSGPFVHRDRGDTVRTQDNPLDRPIFRAICVVSST
jgi:hypothetical protein